MNKMFKRENHKRRVRQDYQNKNLKNPFFRQKKPSRPGVWRFWLVGILAAVILLIWFFLASSIWNIKEIKVEGLTRMAPDEIINRVSRESDNSRYLIFSQHNIFLAKFDDLADRLEEEFNFADIGIKKKLPGTIIVSIQERPYAFIFQEGDKLSYASKDAYIIKDIPVSEEDKTRYFILDNRYGRSLIDSRNKIDIEGKYLDFIFKINPEISARPEFAPDRYIVDQEFNTLKLQLKSGPLIYLNVNNDLEQQLNNLSTIKRELLGDDFGRLEHVDLRYGDKIFLTPENLINKNK